jgi:hypothetical protein
MNPPPPQPSSEAGPQAQPGAPAQAGPLCPRVPVLSVLELASRDARRRPLCLPEDRPNDSAQLREHLEQARRHVHEERCAVCLRWYRNATHAYHDALRQQLLPASRVPRRLAGEDAGRPEYHLEGERQGMGLHALEADLLWRAEPGGRPTWSCSLRLRVGEGGRADLSAFEGLLVSLSLAVEGKERPVRLRVRLGREGEALTSPPERVVVEHPDRVRRVRLRLVERALGLELEG